ncbi:MAG: retroviral-like aspartic protease family protein [Candidatus Omnitrophica bacterium]|nr:retroviral-like aspartic protease family protein [Candidatus Omnitrophota bacterium]
MGHRHQLELTLLLFCAGITLCILGSVTGARPAGAQDWRDQEKEAFSSASRQIIVEANINEMADALFLVDTGSSSVIIPESLADEAWVDYDKKETVTVVVGTGDTIQGYYGIAESIEVQGVTVEDVQVIVVADSDFAFFHYDGILGMSFLKKVNIGIDNENNVVVLEEL